MHHQQDSNGGYTLATGYKYAKASQRLCAALHPYSWKKRESSEKSYAYFTALLLIQNSP